MRTRQICAVLAFLCLASGSIGCASLSSALPPFVDVLSGGRPLVIGGEYTTTERHVVDGVEKEVDSTTRGFGLSLGFQADDE